MNGILLCGSLLGFFAICLGAYTDHVLKATLNEHAISIVSTALKYHQLHAILIVAIGLALVRPIPHTLHKRLTISGWCMILGTLFFSVSLYMSVFSAYTWFTYFTPIGGVTLMFAWAMLTWASITPRNK